MAYGSILSKVSGFSVITADGIHKRVSNNFFTRITIKVLGIPHMGLRMRAEAIVKFLTPAGGDAILDAGCGMGLYILSMAKGIRRGYGVDIDASKIGQAAALARELDLKNVEFKVQDALRLDIADATFDKIICSEVLEHVREDGNLIQALSRILKDGGLLVISTTSLSGVSAAHKEDFGHQRSGYSLEQLNSLFSGTRLFIEEIFPYGLFFGQIAWKINRMLLSSSFLNALTFYPLKLLSLMDNILPRRIERECIGYVIKLRKIKDALA